MMSSKTPLYDHHLAEKGRMVDFAGWDMPVQYESIPLEHKAVRRSAGVFDVGHMGRFWIEGGGAADSLERLTASRMKDMEIGQVRYTVVCNPEGGVKDDILVTRLGENWFVVVVNASNRKKLLPWFREHFAPKTLLDDYTLETGMIAVQGPEAAKIVESMFPGADELAYYHARDFSQGKGEIIVSRTGYTGEDGFEIIARDDETCDFWDRVRALGAQPAGLGARDTLRLEMGYPLYGHELTEEITPLEAGVGWAIHLDKEDFIGLAALKKQKETGVPRRRIGFQLEEKGIPREGCALYAGEIPIGAATSGGFSPTLETGIGMGLVQAQYVKTDNLSVEVRSKRLAAKIVKPPFVTKHVKA
ncbi:MAG: glycine cleavage system aminomethyltransferase GcvT [Candidatus Omnitrophota bacterium]